MDTERNKIFLSMHHVGISKINYLSNLTVSMDLMPVMIVLMKKFDG